jgi:Uma2 family endonuclease
MIVERSALMATATTEQPVLSPPSPPGDDEHFEVVDGRRVETPRMGTFETDVANELNGHLWQFARTNGLGKTAVEMLFRIDVARNLQRRPDVAFVSYQRWPRGRRAAPNDAWDVVPDLAVEVISPSNTAAEILIKVHEYFRAGVRLVWVIYPVEVEVYAYESPTVIRVLQRGDELDGGAVLPGFRLPLATLFEEEEVGPPGP